MDKGEMTRLALDDTRIPCCLGPPPWPANSGRRQRHHLAGELVLQRPLAVSMRQCLALDGTRGACFIPGHTVWRGWCPGPREGRTLACDRELSRFCSAMCKTAMPGSQGYCRVLAAPPRSPALLPAPPGTSVLLVLANEN